MKKVGSILNFYSDSSPLTDSANWYFTYRLIVNFKYGQLIIYVENWGMFVKGFYNVARRSALSEDEIDRIEAGYHTTTDVVIKLAEALRWSTDYLLGCGSGTVVQPVKVKKQYRHRQR